MVEPSHQLLPEDPNHRQQAKDSQRREIAHIGDVEFEQLSPSDLNPIPLVVQALDNQWLPRTLLDEAMQRGEITEKLEKTRMETVRCEYIRALINGEQVVLNRAFLFNNPVVFQDYQQKNKNREAFKALLDEEVIIPFLFSEGSPIDPPAFNHYASSFSGWKHLCQEVRPRCVRLSWDDWENQKLSREMLSSRFHAFIFSASSGDIDTYLAYLGLDSSVRPLLQRCLVDLGQLSLEASARGEFVTRATLYQRFVTQGDATQRRYDITKPFAAEIKQLLDLAYHCNLADAFCCYLMTPADSLPRAALQERKPVLRQSTATLEELVKRLLLMDFGSFQSGLYFKSMGLLSLQSVRDARNTDEWIQYIKNLKALQKNPLQFDHALKVYESYVKLAKVITGFLERQGNGNQAKDQLIAPWTPSLELVIHVASAALVISWTSEGATYQFSGALPSSRSVDALPMIIRLMIRDTTGVRNRDDLNVGFDLIRSMIPDAKKQWLELQRFIKTLPGFQETSLTSLSLTYAQINYQIASN